MVLPLLLVIPIGIVEFGLGFRDILTVGNSTQQSGRVGSSMGSDPQSDLEILAALEQSLTALPNSGVGSRTTVRPTASLTRRASGTTTSGSTSGCRSRHVHLRLNPPQRRCRKLLGDGRLRLRRVGHGDRTNDLGGRHQRPTRPPTPPAGEPR